MEQNIKITNKIITIDTIKKFANYLQDVYKKYDELISNDKEKNELLDYKERNYDYYGNTPKMNYTIGTLDGKTFTQSEYGWFENFLDDPKIIKSIQIQLRVAFNTQTGDTMVDSLSKYLWIHAEFFEDRVNIHVEGKELEDEVNVIYSDLRNFLEESEDRYNNTIKRRGFRMQCFYFGYGGIFAYFVWGFIDFCVENMSGQHLPLLYSKYIIIGVHAAISIIIGNIIGSFFMNKLYENIIPKRKYSHYNKSAGKSVYIDNVEDYVEKNEIQIGKFYNSLERRMKIEKLYRISRIVALVHIIIYLVDIFCY